MRPASRRSAVPTSLASQNRRRQFQTESLPPVGLACLPRVSHAIASGAALTRNDPRAPACRIAGLDAEDYFRSSRTGRPFSFFRRGLTETAGSSVNRGGATTMRSIDDPIVLERGERTSLRQLATEGRLTLRSNAYSPDPASKTPTPRCGPMFGLGVAGR